MRGVWGDVLSGRIFLFITSKLIILHSQCDRTLCTRTQCTTCYRDTRIVMMLFESQFMKSIFTPTQHLFFPCHSFLFNRRKQRKKSFSSLSVTFCLEKSHKILQMNGQCGQVIGHIFYVYQIISIMWLKLRHTLPIKKFSESSFLLIS